MINTLDDYICRSLPQWGDFTTNPNLRRKVDDEGNLLPYMGNTVVFLLERDTKERLGQLQETLYRAAPEMLARRLQPSTFHMTLHDLANGLPDQPGLRDFMAYTEAQTAGILPRWKDAPPLRMKATRPFNMVNTSIVLGLAPADGESRQRLGEMYRTLESVVNLGYALTPHITLAYFRPGTYSPERVQSLSDALKPVELELTLSMDNLVLQNFTDMNHYETILQGEK